MQRPENRYTGQTARTYDERKGSKKWQNEQYTVETLLHQCSHEYNITEILDVPVGTGRFFPIYDRLPVNVTGVDVSKDMLNEAEKKTDSYPHLSVDLIEENIFNLENISVDPDVVVCIRLLNWFNKRDLAKALNSLYSIGPQYLIIGVRTYDQNYTNPVKKSWDYANRLSASLVPRMIYHDDLTIHSQQDWLEILSSHQMNLQSQILVDQGRFGSRSGSEYYIYLLKTTK